MCGKGGYEGISKGSLDLCMIDGNHNAPYVLDDAQHCFYLLRQGGVMLFDDVENQTEKKNHVKQALPTFLEGAGNNIEFLWKHKYMEAYRKT
jgi:predicted O-methyltransferase YrrM